MAETFPSANVNGAGSQPTVEAQSFISMETRYQTQKELFFTTLGKQFDYGKWLLASLLAVHGGSLIAISEAGDAKGKLYHACGPLLIYGLAVTLVAGGLTWINFTAVANVYGNGLIDFRLGREPNPLRYKKIIIGLGDDGELVSIKVADGHAFSEEEAIDHAKEVMVQLTAFGTRGGGRSINAYDAASNGNFDDDEPPFGTWCVFQ